MVVPTIKKEYGSQKDFTQVWNSTMEGVRWAGGDLGVRRNKQAPLTISSPPLQLKCCGFTNYTDFDDSPYVKENNVFPPYCCLDRDNGTFVEPCTSVEAQNQKVEV